MIKRVDNGGLVHLVTNIRKPRKWRRYEYLLCTTTAVSLIDTGIVGHMNYTYEVKFQSVSGTATTILIAGGDINYYTEVMSLTYGSSSNRFWMSYWSKNATNSNIRMQNLDTNVHVAKVSNGYWNWDGIDKGRTALHSDTFTTLSNMKLCIDLSKVFYLKVWDASNNLIQSFVPAEYNGQYGMWDLVEDKFYRNSGTGTFTVGPEMKNYDEIYEVRKTASLLPSGVELYDYILGNSYEWINTNYIGNNTTDIELKYSYNELVGSYGMIGYGQGATTEPMNGFRLYYGGSNRFYISCYSKLNLSTFPSNITFSSGTIYTTFFEGSTGKVTTNSVVNTVSNYGTGSDNTYPLVLFKPYSQCTKGKLYYCKIWNNGILVRNFLPCTYLGEPGMWDTVENKFYRNQGTGLFTLGNKITLKEYEYLLGDGVSCYIDTGFYPNNNTHIKTNILTQTVGNGTIHVYGAAGSSYTDRTFELYDWNNLLLFNYGNSTNYLVLPPLNTWLEIEHNKNRVSCNRTIGTLTASSFNSPTTMYLFSTHRSNATTFGNKSNFKMQYFKLWDNDVLIRDFVPVSYNGTPGLWDKVEWKFYENAGSGSFTLGSEKASGIYPVWTPIEYLESTGTQWINPNLNIKSYGYTYDIKFATGNNITSIGILGYNYNDSGTQRRFGVASNSSNKFTFGFADGSSSYYQPYSFQTNTTYIGHFVFGNTSSLYTLNNDSYSVAHSARSNPIAQYLLALNNNNNPLIFTGKFYYCKIYDEGVLIRDFIPVRIGTTGYMFDKVTGKMYGNSGTGNFILGPDINL